MRAPNLQPVVVSLADRLADLAVDALIDEAELSPKPALVERTLKGDLVAPDAIKRAITDWQADWKRV